MDAFEENSQEEEAEEDGMPQDGDEDLFQPSPEQMEKICAAITQGDLFSQSQI